MDIKILEFKLDQKNNRVGFVDFIIIYSKEKTETFRNVAYFKKVNAAGNTTNWLNLPIVLRSQKFMPVYERTPSIKPLMDKVLKLLKVHIDALN